MVKTLLFKQTFVLLIVIGVLDFFANKLYFYWTIWWFDMLMHFISGFCIGMVGVLIWQYCFDKDLSLKKSMLLSILFSFSVGILWEVFELRFEITSISEGIVYYSDTISDLVLDVGGGILGSFYGHHLLLKK